MFAHLVRGDEEEILSTERSDASARSEALLSMGRCGSVKKSVSASHWPRV
jgi:hypothetical protein